MSEQDYMSEEQEEYSSERYFPSSKQLHDIGISFNNEVIPLSERSVSDLVDHLVEHNIQWVRDIMDDNLQSEEFEQRIVNTLRAEIGLRSLNERENWFHLNYMLFSEAEDNEDYIAAGMFRQKLGYFKKLFLKDSVFGSTPFEGIDNPKYFE